MKNIVVLTIAIVFALYSVPCDAKRPLSSSATAAPMAGTNSVKQLYAELLGQQAQIGEQIANLSTTIHAASRSKANKITKQINLLTDELVAVERRLATFPLSVTNPTIVKKMDQENENAFRKELDSIAAIRVAQSDPFAGRLSSDPELDRMYRNYLASASASGVTIGLVADKPMSEQKITQNDIPQGTVYRVMVAISKTKLPLSQFASLDNVLEQSMPSGGYVYYQGSYDSMSQAQGACNKILSERHFRDAFVVAMKGNRRIPLR